MRTWHIGNRNVTDESPAWVCAELSHNHQGSVTMAREMIRVAKECGADAVKFQKRSPAFYAALRAKGLTEYADLREGRELTLEEYAHLRRHAHDLGLAILATAFDVESVAFLERVGVNAIKLASGAVHNHDLLSAAAATGLPLLLSTGCSSLDDIKWAINAIENPLANLAILQCTSAYPCASASMHLRTIETFRTIVPRTIVGLSSHHAANILEPVAYALGARIFEKHFTLSRDLGPGDHANSLDPVGLRDLVDNLRGVEAAMGDGVKRFLPCEEMGRRRLDVTYEAAAEPMVA
jgi:sialic acid synthase